MKRDREWKKGTEGGRERKGERQRGTKARRIQYWPSIGVRQRCRIRLINICQIFYRHTIYRQPSFFLPCFLSCSTIACNNLFSFVVLFYFQLARLDKKLGVDSMRETFFFVLIVFSFFIFCFFAFPNFSALISGLVANFNGETKMQLGRLLTLLLGDLVRLAMVWALNSNLICVLIECFIH